MADNDTSDTAIFNFDFSTQLKFNKRVGTRYPAPKLTLSLRKNNLLSFGNEFSGQLLDISAKGALLECSERLSKNTKLGMKIVFVDGTVFNLKGKVVREKSSRHYGITFDSYSIKLDEYLHKLLGELAK